MVIYSIIRYKLFKCRGSNPYDSNMNTKSISKNMGHLFLNDFLLFIMDTLFIDPIMTTILHLIKRNKHLVLENSEVQKSP